MIYRDIIQGSEEWHALRLGKVTASRVIDILKGKNGYNASRKNYMAELACEILTGERAEHFVSKPMEWGTQTEPMARAAYEVRTGYLVEEVGFATHPTIEGFGASPDGLPSEMLGLEIKCPNTATHIDVIFRGNKAIKREYIVQINTNMICCEIDRWHFVDFDPRLPEELQLRIIVVDKDRVLCAEIELEVIKFIAELNEMVKKLKDYKE